MRRRPLRIIVVEDDPNWKNELAMMYCRILRGEDRAGQATEDPCAACSRSMACRGRKPTAEVEDRLHKNIECSQSGMDAIRSLRAKKDRYQVASLDINLGGQERVTGLDVLDAVIECQPHAAVVVVTASNFDAELPPQLTADEGRRVHTLEFELIKNLPNAHLYHHKLAPEVCKHQGSEIDVIREQVREFGRRLNYSTLYAMVQNRQKQARTRLQLALAYVLPDSCSCIHRDTHGDVLIDAGNWSRLVKMGVMPETKDEEPYSLEQMLDHLEKELGVTSRLGVIEGNPATRSLQFTAFSSQPAPVQLEWLRRLAKQRQMSDYVAKYPGATNRSNTLSVAISRLRRYLNSALPGTSGLLEQDPKSKDLRLTEDIHFVLCGQSAADIPLT